MFGISDKKFGISIGGLGINRAIKAFEDKRMKTLLLIPSMEKTDIAEAVAQGRHPAMDYHALQTALALGDGQADLLDYAAVEADPSPLVRLVRRAAGRDAALAVMGWQRRKEYGAIFTNGENVGIPLALLLAGGRRRPTHVSIGHRLSAGKKRPFFTGLRADRQFDTIFVYAQSQRDFAEDHLGIPFQKLDLISFQVDDHFFRPLPGIGVNENQICAAGLEWRDYPTLIEAVESMPDLSVKLAAASPWSKSANDTEHRTLPAHVDARRYDYDGLRTLYAQSSFVVVPLKETDFQAGVTTILEAMAMGKAVIATRTSGQTDVLIEGVTGLTVPPGDVLAWQRAITRLREDAPLRERLGRNARRWIEEHATLDRWTVRLAEALQNVPEDLADAPGLSFAGLSQPPAAPAALRKTGS